MRSVGRDPVLLIESNAERSQSRRAAFEAAGFAVRVASDAGVALDCARAGDVGVILLDVMASDRRRGGGALDVLRCLRDEGHRTIVVALVSPGDEDTAVRCIDTGADACVERACSPHELTARIEALVRRSPAASPRDARLVVGDISIDPRARVVKRRDERVALSPREFDLLLALARGRGRVVPRHELLADVWHIDGPDRGHVVESHISLLRHKLEADPRRPGLIVTVRRIGYLMP